VDAERDAGARQRAAVAGHRGDEAGARALLGHPDPVVRATALGALARMDRLTAADVSHGLADAGAAVRRRAAELAVRTPEVPLVGLLDDPDHLVVEAACWALGERGDREGVAALGRTVTDHADPLCREAAVAALGAIGDGAGLVAILAATSDKPAVRRRAVLALAAFEGPDVDAALARALTDRDWQVRQAAEDLGGRGPGPSGASP
jgi:HEAT repeat protein